MDLYRLADKADIRDLVFEENLRDYGLLNGQKEPALIGIQYQIRL